MGELKPCPFCGSDAGLRKSGHATCTNRFCINRQDGNDYPFWAASDWNDRPVEDRLNDLLEQVREAYTEWKNLECADETFEEKLNAILAKRKGE